MNNSKIILSAVAAIAAIGGAFALKANKFSGTPLLIDVDQDGTCTTQVLGFKSIAYQQGYLFNYATVTQQESKDCSRAYYQITP
ncbi:hypothetical protein HNQ91_002039 [Filimonas zeae]|uniref:Uncharacterized protein n=1 Tax=Filimonas zeae TaxID=1737353 RepID=A0A917IVC7_9BACT|nr:DUF6520 family protein [Filimonas zeae]MDR6338988.1 hypothetical protein [Filimonas zeae]GGH65643.1 hypothetical protein GCM10011379_18990 [Filimonas zeae]